MAAKDNDIGTWSDWSVAVHATPWTEEPKHLTTEAQITGKTPIWHRIPGVLAMETPKPCGAHAFSPSAAPAAGQAVSHKVLTQLACLWHPPHRDAPSATAKLGIYYYSLERCPPPHPPSPVLPLPSTPPTPHNGSERCQLEIKATKLTSLCF